MVAKGERSSRATQRGLQRGYGVVSSCLMALQVYLQGFAGPLAKHSTQQRSARPASSAALLRLSPANVRVPLALTLLSVSHPLMLYNPSLIGDHHLAAPAVLF